MHTINHVSVPFTTPFYENLQEGSQISVHGTVHSHHHKDFAVELLSGQNIVLHVNFRFQHHEHILVLNASSYGTWGPEIRVHNPLHDGDHFHLHIHVHHSHYEIEVNGSRVAEFPHRYPFFTVQALGVHGGVEIEKIHFEGFPFGQNWNSGAYDYGHSGYLGYGTEGYIAPTFGESHEYNQHFHRHHHH